YAGQRARHTSPTSNHRVLYVIIGQASLYAAWAYVASVLHQVGSVLKRQCLPWVRTGRQQRCGKRSAL
ncbi:MAG: hypothetical protein ACE5MG_10665, partial [Candidatus Methylomirabilales bacterium]